MTKKQLIVYLNGERVGLLEQTASGKLRYTYDPEATRSISFAMPIREQSYGELETEAFFAGLLPESEHTKKIIARRFGVSANNTFALLKAIGHDCAGAISCYAVEEDFIAQSIMPLTAKVIDEEELYRHLKALPQQPLFLDVDGLRLSLAGVQDKAAICLVDNKIALAEQGCPTTHILKPGSSHFQGMAENEYFCLRIAKLLGLPVPNIELRQIKEISFLLIERYDRIVANGQVQRIHQEDFCQALGILSTRKYQNEGGPNFKQCFDLLKNTARPVIDRNWLASALVFNYLIGNMDAHAKNFSLLHTSSSLKLAPLYDLLCTRVYEQLTDRMAMKIGSKYQADAVFPRHWEQLCTEINYRYPALKNLILKQGSLILKLVAEERYRWLSEGRDVAIVDKIILTITTHIDRTLARFNENKAGL